MNLGEILDRTLQIYRSRFLVFAGVAAIPLLAIELIQLADRTWLHVHSLVHPSGKLETFLWNFVVGLAFYHVSSIFGILVEPAIVVLVSSSILGEERSTISSLQFAGTRCRSFLWIAILKVLAELGIPEVVFTVLAIGTAFLANAAGLLSRELKWTLPLLAAFIVISGIYLFLWIGASLSLAVPAATLEGLAGLRSLRRSWALSKGTRTRIWFTWLVIFASLWVLAWGLEFLLGQVMNLMGALLHIPNVMRNLYAPAVFVLVTVIDASIGPILPIALTLFYYDQRIRKEGFDIERMMETAGMIGAAGLAAEAQSGVEAGVVEGQA
jgi:hypothetical protein